MKRIRSLSTCPPLLEEYINELNSLGETHDYSIFRGRCPSGYKEIQIRLAEIQHGLCAYCEIRILKDLKRELPCQVEHYLPKSSSPQHHLDYRNMIACCHGGDNLHFHRPAMEEFRGLVLKPPPSIDKTKSCGAKKEDFSPHAQGSRVLDPRIPKLTTTGKLPRLIKTHVDPRKGEISLNEDDIGCQLIDLSLGIVNETIQTLNLNSERLKRNRWVEVESITNKLSELKDAGFELEIDDVALLLQPDPATGLLARYWSSLRYHFGDLAEAWLETAEAKTALC